MSDEIRCPKCFSATTLVNGGFLERGPYGADLSEAAREFLDTTTDRHVDEQSVDGYRCTHCNFTFCSADLDPRFDKGEIEWDTVTRDQLVEAGYIERSTSEVAGAEAG